MLIFKSWPALPRWKKFRWLDWAIKHKLWPDPNQDLIMDIKLVCGMSRLDTYVERETEIKFELEAPKPTKEEKKSKKGKSENKSKKDKKSDKGIIIIRYIIAT